MTLSFRITLQISVSFALMFLTLSAVAALPPSTVVNAGSSRLENPRLWCSRDFNSSDTIIEVRAADDALWQLFEGGVLNSFFSDTPIWCQFRVKVQDDRRWFFGFGSPNLTEVDVFQVTPAQVEFSTGTRYRFKQRVVDSRFFYFPLAQANQEQTHLYFRLKTSSLHAPVQLLTEGRLKTREMNRIALGAIAFGMLIPLFASLLLTRKMSGNHRLKLRLLGASLVGAYLLTSTAVQGYGFQYFWSNSLQWNQAAPYLTVTLGIWLVWRYTEVMHNRNDTQWGHFISAMLLFTLLATLLYLFGAGEIFLWLLAVASILAGLALALRTAWLFYRYRNNREQVIWLLWISSVTLTIAQSYGLVTFHLDIDLLTTLNFFALAGIISWDVFLLIRDNQAQLVSALEAKVAKETEIANLQNQRADELESKVQSRTQELAKMMRELHLSNMKLRATNSTDALTGTMNRYAFDEYLERSWQTCIKEQQPFSIGFIDADHFKTVNDTYGHDAGDACLQQMAKMITNSLVQVDMRVARYGGEEFVVIAPKMDARHLVDQLERLRVILADNEIVHGELKFSITVSIGVADSIVTNKADPRKLVKQADTALYHAKNNGRNQTVNYADLSTKDPLALGG